MVVPLAIAALLLTGQQPPRVEGPISSLTVATVEGAKVQVPDARAKATVLIFLYTDCPIANRYAPELKRIEADYAKKNVSFYRVYVYKEATLESIAAHTKDYEYKWPAVHDKDHTLVKATGVRVTPEAVLLMQDGTIAYRGRIDDMYVEHGRLRESGYRRDLRVALDEVLSGKAVTLARTTALGCFIGG